MSMRDRDDVLNAAWAGEITPEDAEGIAREHGWPAFAKRPGPDEDFDPMNLIRWSRNMALAWIMWRTPEAVCEMWDKYQAACLDWRSERIPKEPEERSSRFLSPMIDDSLGALEPIEPEERSSHFLAPTVDDSLGPLERRSKRLSPMFFIVAAWDRLIMAAQQSKGAVDKVKLYAKARDENDNLEDEQEITIDRVRDLRLPEEVEFGDVICASETAKTPLYQLSVDRRDLCKAVPLSQRQSTKQTPPSNATVTRWLKKYFEHCETAGQIVGVQKAFLQAKAEMPGLTRDPFRELFAEQRPLEWPERGRPPKNTQRPPVTMD
jgi:hypothetical protein